MASEEIKKLAVKMAKAGYCNVQACEEYLEAAESLGYERAKEEAAALLDAQYAAYKAREEAQADNSYYISVHSALLATAVELRSDAAAIRLLPERKG